MRSSPSARVKLAVCAAQALDGDELLAVQRRHEQDAGVDRAIAQAIAHDFAEHHGASAAIALSASLLGAASPLGAAKVG